MIEEIAPGVFTVPHRIAAGNNGVVFGRRGAVAIDTGSDADEGETSAALIRDRGRAADRLALTHGHGDHILGIGAFPDAEIYASERTPDVMRAELARLAARDGSDTATLAASVRFPSVTFTGELRLSLGDRTIRAFPTPGHSPDGVAWLLEEDGVLFAGDTVATGIVPAIGQGDSRELAASLRLLAGMAIDLLVPGHGPILRGRAAVADWLDWEIGYLDGLREHARDGLQRGESAEQIVAAADYARFVGDRLPRNRHRMEWRHATTAAKIVAEEAAND